MSARVYFMKTVNGYKDVSIMSLQMNSEDGQVYSVCILLFSCFTKYNVCNQNKNKQIVNIADENPADYSFLRSYHYNQIKELFKWTKSIKMRIVSDGVKNLIVLLVTYYDP